MSVRLGLVSMCLMVGIGFGAGLNDAVAKTSSSAESQKALKMPADVTAPELQKTLTTKHKLFLLDVRSSEEFSDGHIKGAKNIPILMLKNRLAEVPKDVDVVTICLSGGRSAHAADILRSSGYSRVTNFVGGMSTWTGPVEK